MKLFTVTAHVIMSACFSQHIRCLATIFAYPVSHFLQFGTETKCSSRPFKKSYTHDTCVKQYAITMKMIKPAFFKNNLCFEVKKTSAIF